MERIADNITAAIGKTPLIALEKIAQSYGAKARILAKVEGKNPAGSVKDRAALSMIRQAQADGLLGQGATIIEPTSGNTGIGLASIGAQLGYKVILTMPETMTIERRNILKAYGAEVVLTEGKLGMRGAIERAKALSAQTPGSLIPGQFDNPANPRAHYQTTGPEIWEDTAGKVDVLISGVGTGGTISGAGKYLKEQNSAVEIIAVEPAASPVLSGGAPGPHKIQGIGAGFVPGNLDRSVLNDIFQVTDDQALDTWRALAAVEGLFCGISSGAALFAALEKAKQSDMAGKNIVVILPDMGDRYLSLF